MPDITSTTSSESGIPLGGLGTGSIEIRPDGYFHEWQIFNMGRWAPQRPPVCAVDGPEMHPGGLCFVLWARKGNCDPQLRRLGTRADMQNLYSMPWLQNVESITYRGRYPLAQLSYHDPDIPVEVRSSFFSPIVPHDARTSGTPGFHGVFTFRNRSNQPVEISLLGTLRNPLAWHAEDRRLRSKVTRHRDAALLTMRTSAKTPCAAGIGSLGMSFTGGDISWVTGEYGPFIGTFQGPWFQASSTGAFLDSVIHRFRDDGYLPNSPGGTDPASSPALTDEDIESLRPPVPQTALAQRLQRHGQHPGTGHERGRAARPRHTTEHVRPVELRWYPQLHRQPLAHLPRLVLAALEPRQPHQPDHLENPHPTPLLGRRRHPRR